MSTNDLATRLIVYGKKYFYLKKKIAKEISFIFKAPSMLNFFMCERSVLLTCQQK